MKTMKKLVLLSLVALVAVFGAPKKDADAALLLGGLGAAAFGNPELGTALAYSSTLPALVGIMAAGVGCAPIIVKVYIGMTLDENGNASMSDIERQLQMRYPFIDSQETIQRLAHDVSTQYNEKRNEKGLALVTLSEASLADLMADADLSDSEFHMLVRDFSAR